MIQFFGSNIECVGLFQKKKQGGLRKYFFEPSLHYPPLEIPQNCVRSLKKISTPKTKTLGNSTLFFFVTLGNSTSFLIISWKFHMPFLRYPWNCPWNNPSHVHQMFKAPVTCRGIINGLLFIISFEKDYKYFFYKFSWFTTRFSDF